MWARELQAQQRCPVLCRDPDNDDAVVRCARWADHEHEHMTYIDVIADMYNAILRVKGVDRTDPRISLLSFVYYRAARQWYHKLVTG